MSLLRALGLVRQAKAVNEPACEAAARGADEGRAVFQEAALLLDDFHHVRVVIIRILPSGLRIAYAARMDLPFRVRLIAPTLKLKCWTRVARQDEGVAELEFVTDEF